MKAQDFTQLLEQLRGLNHHQRHRLTTTLSELLDEPMTLEVLESHFDRQKRCPHCDDAHVYRHGLSHGLQRYRCRQCNHTFNTLTDTPLSRLRHKEKWLAYLRCQCASLSVRKSADEIGVHPNTVFRWRHRFLEWAKQDRAIHLHGITEVDETYLLESQKGTRALPRKARRRGGCASKRGLSKEQVCILIARDRAGKTLDFLAGKGSISKKQLDTHLKAVLDQDSLLVSDANPAYHSFCSAQGIEHKAVNRSQGQHILEGAFHIQNVNAYHSRLKQWLKPFHGVATKYLSNYLGWRRALDTHHNLSPKDMLVMALGDFQQLTVT